MAVFTRPQRRFDIEAARLHQRHDILAVDILAVDPISILRVES